MAAIFHTKGFSGKKFCYLFRLLQFTLFANISHKTANSHGGSTPWWNLDPIFLAYFHGKTILNTWKWLSRRLCVILNCIKFSKYDTKDFFFWSCISFCKLQRCVISHQVVFNTTILNVLFHLYLSIKSFGKTRHAECYLQCSYVVFNAHMVLCHHIPFIVVTCSNYYFSLLFVTAILSLLLKHFHL